MLSNFLFKHKQSSEERITNLAFKKKYPAFKIGRWSYGLPLVLSWGKDEMLEIGAFCSISDNVKIFTGGEHRTDWVTTFPFPAFFSGCSHIKGHPASKGNVKIGNDVWISFGATILSGVSIGNGAVIGAQALVSTNIPPYAIVAGNPAKIIKYRFSDEIIETLERIAWWNWPDEVIKEHIDIMLTSDIERFLKQGLSITTSRGDSID